MFKDELVCLVLMSWNGRFENNEVGIYIQWHILRMINIIYVYFLKFMKIVISYDNFFQYKWLIIFWIWDVKCGLFNEQTI